MAWGFRKATPIVLLAAVLVAACNTDAGDGSDSEQSTTEIPRGGTLRIASTTDVDFMDPAAAYYVATFALHRGVVRTLVTNPATSDREEQSTIVPDLATDTGEANDDFTEWTYTLQDGIKYGPALGGEEVSGVTGEEIVCEDLKYGMERIFIPSVGGGYPFYYEVLEGASEFADGKADEITGIECVDDKTVVFRLTEPTGDWPYRLGMPAATPVPERYAAQFDKEKDSDYDNHIISTGPYYVAEWLPEERIVVERNEYWDPETDDIRPAYVDSIFWRQGFDLNVGVQQVVDNRFDVGLDLFPTGPQLEEILNDPELRDRLIVAPSLCTSYTFMNTTVEPFDDLKVREAVNFAIDRANLRRLGGGGSISGDFATSIIPPGMGGHLTTEEFNPFGTPGMSGDMDRAKQLMAEAGYPNGYDKEILLVGSVDDPVDKQTESVRADLQELGFSNITVKLPPYPNNYTQFFGVTDSNTAVGVGSGWCKDYNDAFTFFDPLLNGDNISYTGANVNSSELDDPELNALIDEAAALPPGDERVAAWEEANRVATELAPWVLQLWIKDRIMTSEDLVNAYYNTFFAGIDPVAVGVRRE